jgi:isopenicillin-N N-acyltransferase-like protein
MFVSAAPRYGEVKTPAFPLIEMSGGPEERGRQYGRAAGDRIRRCAEIYLAAFAGQGVSWDRARELARGFAQRIEAYDPQAIAEIRGIAAGAEMPFEDIVALNARTELLYGASKGPPKNKKPDQEPDGCTGAIVRADKTANGHTLHGQNWDWRDECADVGVVLRIAPENGPRILCFVEAGMLARAGVNEHGVSITGNFLACEQDGTREGVPIPLIRRQVLMSDGLAMGIQAVTRAPRAFSNNLMIAHDRGEAVDLEGTPEECFWIMMGEDGLLVHANHFVSEAARAKVTDQHLPLAPDTIYRDIRVRRHLAKHAGKITKDVMIEAFQDRYGWPRSVLRFPTQGMGGRISSSVATIIMDTTDKRMWIAPRPYGVHEFTEYRLD